MSKCYRLLQLVNTAIGAVTPDTVMPLGVQNRSVETVPICQNTFVVTTTANNVIYVKEAGLYKVTYTAYLTVGGAGDIIVNLQVNGVTVQTATVTVAAAGTYLVAFTYVTSTYIVPPLNAPLAINVQLGSTSVALTGGSSVMQVERTYVNQTT